MPVSQLSFKMGMAIYQVKKIIQTVACHSQSSSAANSANRAVSLQSSMLDSSNFSPSISVEELKARDGSDLPNILDLKNSCRGFPPLTHKFLPLAWEFPPLIFVICNEKTIHGFHEVSFGES